MATIHIAVPSSFIPVDPPPFISRTAATGHMFAAFDAAVDELVDITFNVTSEWVTGTQTLNIRWRADAASSGNVVWSAQVEALTADDALDTGATESFATAQFVTDTAPGTAGYQTVAQITFTAAQADNMIAEDHIRVRLSRDATDSADSMAGDAEILGVWWDDAG